MRGRSEQSRNFNPRPLTGGDAGFIRFNHACGNFNPRPLTGGDSPGRYLAYSSTHFNPRPLTGGDGAGNRVDNVLPDFNPRPLTGGDYMARRVNLWAIFQSTPPHRGRLQLCTKKHNHNNNLYKKVLSLREKNEKYFQYTTISLEISSFLRCESPGNFMYPLYSHPMIFTTKSTACPDPVHDQHQYAPPLSYDDSQDSKTERCPFLGQLSPQERL